jgi:hypothetical protein
MPDYPLIVFAADAAIPLTALRDLLLTEGLPANFGVDIAGEATDEQLSDPEWEIAFLRWLEPEVHEVALIEPMDREKEEEAQRLISHHLYRIARLSDVAGRLIVANHLNRTRIVYAVQILPALLAEDSHDAWNALDILLRFLAQTSDGVIYAEAEGYCDADGELLLGETDDLNHADTEAFELSGN